MEEPMSQKRLDEMKVLVLDDDHLLTLVLKSLLERLGVSQVMARNDSLEALEELRREPTAADVILLDLMMPKLDGIEFLSELIRIDFQGFVILMTGADKPILASLHRLGGQRLRMLGVLEKPVRLAVVRALLAKIEESANPALQRISPRTSAAAITTGLLRGEFIPYFQPKVSLADGRVTGFEALARWRRPNGTLVTPVAFIPVAEKKGLIHEIDLAILDQTLAELSRWREQGLRLTAAVNCSATTLSQPGVTDALLSALRRYSVETGEVLVELTESVLIDEDSLAMANILRLHLYGVHLSMDDFGTGYSSLLYLSQIPFSELKVDQCFVTGAGGDAAKKAIIEHSVTLAKKLALSVVCEGIEHADDAALVRALGANLGQGFFYTKPLPAAEFLAWVRTRDPSGDMP